MCLSDDEKVKSGQALAGGSCPTGQLGDGVTCKVNPCFLKNGGCDALTTCAADTATGDAVCGACPAGYERSGGQLTACENIDGCAKDPCYALVGRCRLTPGGPQVDPRLTALGPGA